MADGEIGRTFIRDNNAKRSGDGSPLFLHF
jgi:hypothetical protein